ncbi:hypothetical protein MED297_03210 [Reinekea sp. MED297]|uniref:Uncharacterized protein n=2 Tax=Reinekea TaxID=230494 RepID=A4BJB7_9GAMM|nr:hypothetical protein MED297_03210 [Reinekea sp. MED297] [Reinekea blandensis MED297]
MDRCKYRRDAGPPDTLDENTGTPDRHVFDVHLRATFHRLQLGGSFVISLTGVKNSRLAIL